MYGSVRELFVHLAHLLSIVQVLVGDFGHKLLVNVKVLGDGSVREQWPTITVWLIVAISKSQHLLKQLFLLSSIHLFYHLKFN